MVGHTEAASFNSGHRLVSLGIDSYFRALYCPSGNALPHPLPGRGEKRWGGLIRALRPDERKPNAEVLLDICDREGFSPNTTFYVGDSLPRDMMMARNAGVAAIWARYGTRYD